MFREIHEITTFERHLAMEEEAKNKEYLRIKPSDDFEMSHCEVNNFWKEIFNRESEA